MAHPHAVAVKTMKTVLLIDQRLERIEKALGIGVEPIDLASDPSPAQQTVNRDLPGPVPKVRPAGKPAR